MTTTPCTGCAVQQGTHQPAEALHQIAEPKTQQPEALRLADLSDLYGSYRSAWDIDASAELRRQHARIVELETQIAAAQQAVQPAPAHPAEGVPAQAAKLPPLPEPTAFLVCKGSEVTARAWNVDQMRAYAAAALAATHPTQQGMDARATRYEVKGLTVECRGNGKWAVVDGYNVLNRYGEWKFEPSPSSRTDEWLALCRFDSAQEAIAAAQAKQGGAA